MGKSSVNPDQYEGGGFPAGKRLGIFRLAAGIGCSAGSSFTASGYFFSIDEKQYRHHRQQDAHDHLYDVGAQDSGQLGSEQRADGYRDAHFGPGLQIQIAFLFEYERIYHELGQDAETGGAVGYVDRHSHRHEQGVGDGGRHSRYRIDESHQKPRKYDDGQNAGAGQRGRMQIFD